MSALDILIALIKDITFTDAIDVILVSYSIYLILRFVEGSRAFNLMKGILVVVAVMVIANWFHFNTMVWMLQKLLPSGVVVIAIIFQPEIRRAFEDIGRGQFLAEEADVTEKSLDEMAENITKAIISMSEKHVGALVLIEQSIGLKEYIDNGVALKSAISSEIIGAIFWPFAPLHDGAMIIKGQKIEAAGCFLPTVSNHKAVSRELGSRHRAAISTSELTDALILVVSEETGTVSRASGGLLERNLTRSDIKKYIFDALVAVNLKGGKKSWGFYKK